MMEDFEQRRNLERFGQLVLADRELLDQLRATPDAKTFASLAVRLGAARGCDFTAVVVEAVLNEQRRAWLERWL
ncbi:MAG TPA: hypothetical protein VG938_20655 [Verrucomicrobiae bacterium]|jgi:hypothetical protein|nr:hypothetical protein [Verrucomicrobiae bacterium]